MNIFKILIYFLMGILIAGFVSAATIYGTVYDLSLRKVSNARVEINTSPRQFFIAQNASYSFNVPFGAYKIKAQLIQKNNVFASTEENITISQNGDYVLDMILFPNVEEGVEGADINAASTIPDMNNGKNYQLIWIFLIIIVSIISAGIYHFYFKNKNESNDDAYSLNNLTEIIKKEGGRATQKEIRKQIPLSEAKISLMIAELEHKGVVEKIKKGRGNIIILKKK